MTVIVERPGFLTTVQDLGRNGYANVGVSAGGALDRHALRVANALVGNSHSTAGLELTYAQTRLKFSDERLIAWCGGNFDVRIDSHVIAPGEPHVVAANAQVVIAAPPGGGRAWLAISGGVDVPLVLGSRSTDLRAGFGGFEGRSLAAGDLLSLGGHSARSVRLIQRLRQPERMWRAPAPWSHTGINKPVVLRVMRGAIWEEFDERSRAVFLSETFLVTAESDRMGVRFDGPVLTRLKNVDLLSEAVVAGTIQVPPGGNPMLLLGDCQTIGGYPKFAHVITLDLAIAAQLMSGDVVRFRESSLTEAHEFLCSRENEFQRFQVGVELLAS